MNRWVRLAFILIAHTVWMGHLNGVTLVYNLKVRRIFNIRPVLERMKSKWILAAVPIYFHRSRNLLDTRTNLEGMEKRTAGGALLNLRYVHDTHWFGEVTTGFEIDSVDVCGTDPLRASRAGVDDVVCAAGYRHFVGEKGQLVGYGLIGLPTRRKITPEDRHGSLVGTRLYNLGFGVEASYSLISELRQSLSTIFQLRFLHGISRSYAPVLPRDARLQPGNSTDCLFTLQYRHKRTIIETGCDVTFFTNQAIRLPSEIIKADTLTRHSGYLSATHAFKNSPFTKPFLMGAGLNLAGSHQLNLRTVTAWMHMTFVF